MTTGCVDPEQVRFTWRGTRVFVKYKDAADQWFEVGDTTGEWRLKRLAKKAQKLADQSRHMSKIVEELKC